jgi:hypothetical protein
MGILIFIAIATILFGAGYAFRGAIGREVKSLGATLTADRAVLVSEVRAEVAKGTADAKAEYAKVVADATAAVTAVEKKI